ITIGDELLIGHTVDTNAAFIASALNSIGISVKRKYIISDKKDEISTHVKQALSEVSIVLTTGGLGPTNDDITKKVLCELFNTELVLSEEALMQVKQFLEIRNLPLNKNNLGQAYIPQACTLLTNKYGTAPGMLFKKSESILISMPGVPHEMISLMTDEVLPAIKSLFSLDRIIHKVITVGGIAEAVLAEKLSEWENKLPEYIHLAYLPSPGVIKLRLSVYNSNDNHIHEVEHQANKLYKIIPDNIISMEGLSLTEVLGKILNQKTLTIGTAESCTGGAIASEITSIAGSSDYFKGSVVAYHNSIKENILNVSKSDLETYGAVSKQVAESMAKGIAELLKTDISIAVTGIAGPGGGTSEKPVGTVWIAISIKGKVLSQKYKFGNRRDTNIRRTVNAGILFLINELKRVN
ncbi:MAG TPA: CinA family nicotinamide mononucleotide deamidase-related protein, partial [Bacteroidales bacterium]|nr:CinA family nicotinamide mononucleotide deamidase-related protein [Bacteroidales bacterium]